MSTEHPDRKEPQRWGRVSKGRQRLREASASAGSYARNVGRFLIRRLLFTVFVLFVVSLLYIFWFRLGWVPPSGIPIGTSVLEAVLQGRFILPWIVVSLTFAAFYARMVRGNLIETMNEDYIRTARAKGLTEHQVIYKHGLRAASPPWSRC